jgi:hypothetical protein
MTSETPRRHAVEAVARARAAAARLADVLARAGLGQGVILGVGSGEAAEVLLENPALERLFGVDPYRPVADTQGVPPPAREECDSLCTLVRSRLARYGERYRHRRAGLDEAAKNIPDTVDFVHLSGVDSCPATLADLRTWFGKIRDGGIISGRATTPTDAQSAERFFGRLGWPVHDAGDGLWWTVKRTVPVSFFMPAFECAATVEQSLASIIDTNLGPDDEILVVDDGSNDDTVRRVERLAARESRLRLIRHARNKGGAAARNTAVEAALHPVLFCLDSDNLLAVASVAPLRDFLVQEGADVAAFQELRYFVDSPARPTHLWRFKPGVVSLGDYLAGTIVPGASGNYLFTRASWERANGYPQGAGALDTWGFGLRQVATGARMTTLPGTFYFHRYGHDSYWVRDTRDTTTSLRALALLMPFLDAIDTQDVEYLFGKQGRAGWFQTLDTRSLRIRGQGPSVAGTAHDADGTLRPPQLAHRRPWWAGARRLFSRR